VRKEIANLHFPEKRIVIKERISVYPKGYPKGLALKD
jgi:hypothetical protein